MGWLRRLAAISRRQRKKNDDNKPELNQMDTLVQKITAGYNGSVMWSGWTTQDYQQNHWKHWHRAQEVGVDNILVLRLLFLMCPSFGCCGLVFLYELRLNWQTQTEEKRAAVCRTLMKWVYRQSITYYTTMFKSWNKYVTSVVKSRWLCYCVESRSICLKFYFVESRSSFKFFYFLESRK